MLALLAGASAAAQEPPLPADAVASVGGQVITRAELDFWFTPEARRLKVDPPRFQRCIAALRDRAADRPTQRRRDLRRLCARREEAIRRDVMTYLIEALWLRQEAQARGIEVTLRQVLREFSRQKRVAFESEREYRRYLRQSGLTEAHILHRVALSLLQERVTHHVTARPVTRAEARRRVARNRSDYRGIPREEAIRMAEGELRAIRQQRALERFIADFHDRYRAITVCADGYVVRACGQRA